MSPLVRKELRLLGPSWLLGFVAVTSLWWLPLLQPGPGLAGAFLFLGAAAPFLVALNALGREIGLGTFSAMFSEPISRARLWRTKTSVLALALLALFGLWVISYFRFLALEAQYLPPAQRTPALALIGVGLFALAAYSGGLWTVMLFRQVAAALWFAILVPVGLLSAIESIFARFPERETAHLVVLILVFTAYSVAGFLWARRMFLRAQDVHWTGGTLTLPNWRRGPGKAAGVVREHASRPGRALWRKELHLQHGQLLLAGVLALMHLAVLGLRQTLGAAPRNSLLEMLYQAFWGFWLVLPLLIGAAAVADERKLGTLEAGACLPVSRHRQFRIKFLFVLVAGGVFGALVPWLFEGSEGALGAILNSSGQPAWWSVILPGLLLLLVAIGISTVSFYASTLARNTLQAIGLAVALLGGLWILPLIGSQPEETLGVRLWRGPLFLYLGAIILFGTVVFLARWNFKRGQAGQTLWRRNTVVLTSALAFIVLATAALYHRAWEPFTAREPAHGPAQLRQADVVEFTAGFQNITFLRADGRLALHQLLYPGSGRGGWRNVRIRGQWVEGNSNWISADVFSSQLAAIRTDGSLWVSEQPNRLRRSADGLTWETSPLVRVGDATHWQQVRGTYHVQGMMLLLSRDGALWRWGYLDPAQRDPAQRGRGQNLSASEPVRWGADTDWSEIISFQHSASVYLRKRDGSMWMMLHQPRSRIEPDLPLQRQPGFEGVRWRAFAECWRFRLGVQENGSLWAFGMLPPSLRSASGLPAGIRTDDGVQVGSDSDWRSVAARGEHVIGLKADGSLWRWDFGRLVARTGPSPLGRNRDWVAVGIVPEGFVSLAADGSLWRWDFEPQEYHRFRFPVPYLGPSRMPQRIGDVFANVGSLPVVQ